MKLCILLGTPVYSLGYNYLTKQYKSYLKMKSIFPPACSSSQPNVSTGGEEKWTFRLNHTYLFILFLNECKVKRSNEGK
jgi:hypothetical protein